MKGKYVFNSSRVRIKEQIKPTVANVFNDGAVGCIEINASGILGTLLLLLVERTKTCHYTDGVVGHGWNGLFVAGYPK